MSEATVRGIFCGPNATSISAAVCVDVKQKGRPLYEVAYARYSFECMACQNLNTTCAGILVNTRSNGQVHEYMQQVLCAVLPMSGDELQLALTAIIRQDYEQLPVLMARWPLTVAPVGARLLCDDTADDQPQSFSPDAQLALIMSGHCGGHLSKKYLAVDPPVPDNTVGATLRWMDVKSWRRWIVPPRIPRGTVSALRPLACRWHPMMASALNFSLCRGCAIGFAPRHRFCPMCGAAGVNALPLELRLVVSRMLYS